MHLAYVSQFDAHDVRAWSGIPHYMARGLGEHIERLSIVSPLSGGLDPRGRWEVARARLRGRTYLRQHTMRVAQRYAEEARQQLDRLQPDAVITPSLPPLAALDVPVPTACWGDATFEANLYTYGAYTTLSDEMIAEGHRVEGTALSRVAAAFFTGAHAVRSAVEYYGMEAHRVAVVPYGANLETVPSRAEVEQAIEGRDPAHCHLLFLGNDWVRKGGDIAVKVAEHLHRQGQPVTLSVVGRAPSQIAAYPFVRAVGFVDKRTESGRRFLNDLLARSHFLILPSRAENFGCVYCEASAYGIPSLAADVGGVANAVRDGVNGRLFPARPSPQAIAEAVQELLAVPDAYRTLAHSSRTEYEERLNWTSAAAGVVERLNSLIG